MDLVQLFGRSVSLLLDLLAPPACAACDAPACGSGAFCTSCGLPSPDLDPHRIDGVPVPVLVAGSYTPPLSLAVTRFKYGARPELAPRLAGLLQARVAALALQRGVAFVPVPLHARRLATRGYNQAGLLAQELAKGARLPCEPRRLRRTRDTPQQVGQQRAVRLTNTSGAFTCVSGAASRVVLVDDVVTTGSTVRACAQALALAERPVELVAVVALARAGRD